MPNDLSCTIESSCTRSRSVYSGMSAPTLEHLGPTTIASNIGFGVPRQQIDFAVVKQAARTANLQEFVSELQQGHETQMGERGVRLSGDSAIASPSRDRSIAIRVCWWSTRRPVRSTASRRTL